mmetsp:Transcript_20701/g.57811  ORF Transcript_20701/g.57811 Transcript_20701/m.57811 type:complete len:218 (-) Transcript_20701:427-1080(-)
MAPSSVATAATSPFSHLPSFRLKNSTKSPCLQAWPWLPPPWEPYAPSLPRLLVVADTVCAIAPLGPWCGGLGFGDFGNRNNGGFREAALRTSCKRCTSNSSRQESCNRSALADILSRADLWSQSAARTAGLIARAAAVTDALPNLLWAVEARVHELVVGGGGSTFCKPFNNFVSISSKNCASTHGSRHMEAPVSEFRKNKRPSPSVKGPCQDSKACL